MTTETIKFFNTTKGFGFITPDDGSKDVFVHISAVERSELGYLTGGQNVSGLLLRHSFVATGHNALRRSGPGQKHAVAMLQWLWWGVLISGSTGWVHYPSLALSNLVSASGCPRLSQAACGIGSL